jgi:hypothetical protein
MAIVSWTVGRNFIKPDLEQITDTGLLNALKAASLMNIDEG